MAKKDKGGGDKDKDKSGDKGGGSAGSTSAKTTEINSTEAKSEFNLDSLTKPGLIITGLIMAIILAFVYGKPWFKKVKYSFKHPVKKVEMTKWEPVLSEIIPINDDWTGNLIKYFNTGDTFKIVPYGAKVEYKVVTSNFEMKLSELPIGHIRHEFITFPTNTAALSVHVARDQPDDLVVSKPRVEFTRLRPVTYYELVRE